MRSKCIQQVCEKSEIVVSPKDTVYIRRHPLKNTHCPNQVVFPIIKKEAPRRDRRGIRRPLTIICLYWHFLVVDIIPEYTKFKCSILFSRLRRRQVLGGALRAERGWTWSDPYNENRVWRAYIDDGKTTSSVTTVISKTILVSTSVPRGSSSICRSSWWPHDVCDEDEPQVWWSKEQWTAVSCVMHDVKNFHYWLFHVEKRSNYRMVKCESWSSKSLTMKTWRDLARRTSTTRLPTQRPCSFLA